jgi:hypothetical protein
LTSFEGPRNSMGYAAPAKFPPIAISTGYEQVPL